MNADHPNHVWTYDFVCDVDESGRKLRFLTIEDEFTREAVAIEASTRLPSRKVIDVLARVIGERGAPEFIRSDNGPEFIAKALMNWLKEHGVKTHHIDPENELKVTRANWHTNTSFVLLISHSTIPS